tara:strand:+ start:802 stop:1251 length:450 start_codon:yes stop_codon:yes gene_type:complete
MVRRRARTRRSSTTRRRSRGDSLKSVGRAFALEGRNFPEAAVKGLGNAVIISGLDGLAGSPLAGLPTIGGNGSTNGMLGNLLSSIPWTISANTVINYLALNRFKASFNIYALFGSLLAIVAGVNPAGSKSGYNKAMPYVPRADIGMRGL